MPAQPHPAAALSVTFEIEWVWGRERSEFHAIVPAPDGSKAILARSPRFRWWLPVSPDATRGVVAAHETLVGKLLAAGWQPCGGGSLLNWYAKRFRAPETFAARPGTGSDA